MGKSTTQSVSKKEAASYGIRQKLTDLKLLVKLRLNFTVVFSSLMAYLIASNGPVKWQAILILGLGGFFITSAANALNQVLEKDFDKLMKRTKDRPLAAGRMQTSEAVLWAGFLCMFGVVLLALFNPWASFLGMIAMVSYAFVYTPLKRISPVAVLVGAIPGALPVLIGAVAAEGTLTVLGLTLFGIQFFWQFPHFWSIGWLGFEDYKKAGFKLVSPDAEAPSRSLGMQSFIYALFLIPFAFVPMVIGITSWVSVVVILLLTLGYAYMGLNMYHKNTRKAALQVMFYSFAYLPMVLIVLFLDKL